MRILMLTDFYKPIIGGLEQHVQSLSTELVARGHDVAIVTFWHPGLPAYEVDQGIRIYRVQGIAQRIPGLFSQSSRRFAPPLPDPAVTRALRTIIRQERPDLVHAHNWIIYSFLPIKAWSRTKLCVTLHDYNLLCPKKTLMHQDAPCTGAGVAKCLRCAAQHYGPLKGLPTTLAHMSLGPLQRALVDQFICVSHAVAEGSGLPGGNTPYQVIPNFIRDHIPVDPAQSVSYRAQLPDGEYLLFVGALARNKGIQVLLDAYAGLANAPPLVLIGATTPDTPASFPDHVVVHKDWPHSAVMAAWQQSRIALVPSIWPDPCPTVALEAMASGRPLVASRVGGLIDIVDDRVSGLLVPPNKPQALRQAIQHLLADPTLHDQMSHAARKRADMFKASAIIPQIEALYARTCTASTPVQARS